MCSSQRVTISAPGKLMLFGEHAVVYHHPCLVTAVGQRMYVEVEQTSDRIFELQAPEVHVTNYLKPIDLIGAGEIPKGAQFVEIAVHNFYSKYNLSDGIKISTTSEFSSQFGFGSSSASTVCVIYALSQLHNLKLSKKEIFDLAYKTVLDIQGKGSGFDVAAAVYGGTLYYVTGGALIDKLEIEQLPLIVGYSGVKADTVTLLHSVAEKLKKYPEIIHAIYVQIENIVELARKKLLKGDISSLGELMNVNQGYLESLGVSTLKLSRMIYSARDSGAFGAKLSGAGGGDCMIAVAPDDKTNAVQEAIEKVDGRIISIDTNVEGVRTERKS